MIVLPILKICPLLYSISFKCNGRSKLGTRSHIGAPKNSHHPAKWTHHWVFARTILSRTLPFAGAHSHRCVHGNYVLRSSLDLFRMSIVNFVRYDFRVSTHNIAVFGSEHANVHQAPPIVWAIWKCLATWLRGRHVPKILYTRNVGVWTFRF